MAILGVQAVGYRQKVKNSEKRVFLAIFSVFWVFSGRVEKRLFFECFLIVVKKCVFLVLLTLMMMKVDDEKCSKTCFSSVTLFGEVGGRGPTFWYFLLSYDILTFWGAH